MIDAKKYQALKDRAKKLESETERAKGALQQIKTSLKEQFDCGTIKDARKLLDNLIKETKEVETDFNDKLRAFEKRWGSLKDLDDEEDD
jgi:hypothetical protein